MGNRSLIELDGEAACPGIAERNQQIIALRVRTKGGNYQGIVVKIAIAIVGKCRRLPQRGIWIAVRRVGVQVAVGGHAGSKLLAVSGGCASQQKRGGQKAKCRTCCDQGHGFLL